MHKPSGLTITQAAEAIGVTRNNAFGTRKQEARHISRNGRKTSKVFGGSAEGWLVQ
jgi:plasmid maintenance system antidote protein VapI